MTFVVMIRFEISGSDEDLVRKARTQAGLDCPKDGGYQGNTDHCTRSDVPR